MRSRSQAGASESNLSWPLLRRGYCQFLNKRHRFVCDRNALFDCLRKSSLSPTPQTAEVIAVMTGFDSSRESSVREESAISGSDMSEKRRDGFLSGDEEKAIGLDETGYSASKEKETVPPGNGNSRNRLSEESRTMMRVESHHSRAGADGYTWHHDGDESNQQPNRAKDGVVSPEPYLVSFDGDADPENPRSMSLLRRWAIVLICSASSLCV